MASNNNNNFNKLVSKNKQNRWLNRQIMPRNLNPPQFNSSVRMTYKQRYLSTSAGGHNIKTLDLFNTKIVAATAILGYSIFQGLRILKVEMWCSNSAGSTPLTLEIAWEDIANQYIGSPGSNVSDTAMGTADVAHVHAKPPKNSFAETWLPLNPASNMYVFSIVCPAGTVIDVTYDAYLGSDQGPFNSVTLSGATPGILYTRALDNTTSGVLIPVVVNTI
jgi:hypothetical protein